MNLFQNLILILSACVLALFPESEFIFQSIVFIVTGLTIQMFYRMAKDPSLIKFSNLACFSILFGYIVSTAAYAAINLMNFGKVSFTYNFFGLSYQQSIISYTVIMILIISVILSAFSNFEKPLWVKGQLSESISKKTIVLLVLSAVLIIFALINGDLGYMGISKIFGRRISPLGALCFNMLPPLAILSISFLAYMPPNQKRYTKLLVALSVFFILALVPTGRRVLMYTILIALLCISPQLWQKYKEKKIKIVHIIGVSLAIILILSLGFRLFFAMRISITKMAQETKPSITEIIPYTADLLKNSYVRAEINEKLYENLSHRPFILSYLAGILAAHSQKSTPAFSELSYALHMSVPSLLQPQKTKNLAPSAEDIIHPKLGLPIFDGPNTILTAGLNDLGIIGVLIYPTCIVLLYIFIIHLARKKAPPFIYFFILARLLYSILYLEVGLGVLVGSGLRDLFIIVIVYWLVLKMPMPGLVSNRLKKPV